jgi:hypothetical protein
VAAETETLGAEIRVPSPDAVFHLIRTLGPENFHISFVLLTFNIVQSREDFHAAILVSCSTSALQAAIKAVMIRRPFAVS